MKCVCCNKKVKFINYKGSIRTGNVVSSEANILEENIVFSVETNKQAENNMWLNGVVTNMSAGYGSEFDGDKFVLAICDLCIQEKYDIGAVAFIGNYMHSSDPQMIESVEKSKKVWRRNNSLDSLDDYLSS